MNFLNPTKCNHFDKYFEQKRCPFSSVCTDDCLFNWKKQFDDNLSDKVEELEGVVDDLEYKNDQFEEEIDDLRNQRDVVEEDYNDLKEQVHEVLVAVMDGNTAEKLYDYYKKSQSKSYFERIGSWAVEVYNEWSINNAISK